MPHGSGGRVVDDLSHLYFYQENNSSVIEIVPKFPCSLYSCFPFEIELFTNQIENFGLSDFRGGDVKEHLVRLRQSLGKIFSGLL